LTGRAGQSVPAGTGVKPGADGHGDTRSCPECDWCGPRLLTPGNGLGRLALGVGAGRPWIWVAAGVGWQLAKEGPGVYRGYFECKRELPRGVGLAGLAGTRGVLRGLGSLVREARTGELLMMTGVDWDRS
jgi:hypothetical protein